MQKVWPRYHLHLIVCQDIIAVMWMSISQWVRCENFSVITFSKRKLQVFEITKIWVRIRLVAQPASFSCFSYTLNVCSLATTGQMKLKLCQSTISETLPHYAKSDFCYIDCLRYSIPVSCSFCIGSWEHDSDSEFETRIPILQNTKTVSFINTSINTLQHSRFTFVAFLWIGIH